MSINQNLNELGEQNRCVSVGRGFQTERSAKALKEELPDNKEASINGRLIEKESRRRTQRRNAI